MAGRDILRNEAKKVYKEQTKGVPKRQRLPFNEFFKQYRRLKLNKNSEVIPSQVEEDFDFDDLVNVNEISDENLTDIVETEVVEDKEEV